MRAAFFGAAVFVLTAAQALEESLSVADDCAVGDETSHLQVKTGET